jgi:hypothetical protein
MIKKELNPKMNMKIRGPVANGIDRNVRSGGSAQSVPWHHLHTMNMRRMLYVSQAINMEVSEYVHGNV